MKEMVEQRICDNCKKVEAKHTSGTTFGPDVFSKWISMNMPDGPYKRKALDFCSTDCTLAWLKQVKEHGHLH
jgi:hypothetical protein